MSQPPPGGPVLEPPRPRRRAGGARRRCCRCSPSAPCCWCSRPRRRRRRRRPARRSPAPPSCAPRPARLATRRSSARPSAASPGRSRSAPVGADESPVPLASGRLTGLAAGRPARRHRRGRPGARPGRRRAGSARSTRVAATGCRAPRPTSGSPASARGAEHDSVLELVNPDAGPGARRHHRPRPDRPARRAAAARHGGARAAAASALDLGAVAPRRGELTLRSRHLARPARRARARLLDELGAGRSRQDWLPRQAAPATDNLLLGLPPGAGHPHPAARQPRRRRGPGAAQGRHRRRRLRPGRRSSRSGSRRAAPSGSRWRRVAAGAPRRRARARAHLQRPGHRRPCAPVAGGTSPRRSPVDAASRTRPLPVLPRRAQPSCVLAGGRRRRHGDRHRLDRVRPSGARAPRRRSSPTAAPRSGCRRRSACSS